MSAPEPESTTARAARRVQATGTESRPVVDGKFLRVNGERFWVRGVTYGSFRPDDDGEPYPPMQQVRDDFARMRDAGINTIRLYSPPPDRIADTAAVTGLYLVPDVSWGPRRCELDDPDRVRFIFEWAREHSRRLAQHPAVLMYSIGNEIPPLVVRWYGRKRIEAFLRALWNTIKEQSPHALVTYVNHPPTEHLHLPFLDVVSYNIFLERERDFRKYLARLQSLAGDRPLVLCELGLDSFRHGEEAQARFLDWALRAVFEKGLCGASVYSWTDEWGIFDEEIKGWAFGLTDAQRRPKPALAAVRRVYTSSLYALRQTPWPSVSVIVASYNGAATLDECLASLGRLNYPNYEVVVVDDGSTDATSEIVKRHPVRCVRAESNGGLSRARNKGIAEAAGEIVAFTDSDAYVDPDWLYYLVTALEEQNAAAVGGPNLSPPEDGLIAQCVDHAPGNPTHVLLDDEQAEHVPGCNMAYRRHVLETIRGFDPTHRAAGDDVDVCWKLLVRGKTIAFSPSAIVWHHRRPTVGAFLRQQRGYGFAEACLRQRYPGRFNVFGYRVWAGGIYDGVHTGWRLEGMPSLFRPRVYQGRFGSAQFQSLYQPFITWWFQVFTMVEWQTLSACVLAAGLLGLLWSPSVSASLLALAAGMGGATLCAAATSAVHAGRAKRWRGRDRWRGLVTVAWLHMTQPLARAQGRLRGWWRTRATGSSAPAVQRVWGNLAQRERWLELLEIHLRACGWICRPSSDWDTGDLDILGPGPVTAQLCSVYEEELERSRHYVRYRVTAGMKPWAFGVAGVLCLALPAFVLIPYLLPLVVPIGAALGRLLRAKEHITVAVSQLALECAEALEMAKVAEP